MCASCSSFDLPAPPNATTDATDEGSSTAGSETEGDLDRATVTHAFGLATLGPFEEIEPCVSWTLDNEQALYVQAVTLANESGFHHSNWFVVPESVYEGPDGYWNCDDRGFEEIASAAAGTVLFAQSTQSWLETQRLGEGAVIKIPARSRIVAGVHLLNLAPRDVQTDLWLTLEIVHPKLVDTVVTPMRLSYLDLEIAAMGETRHDANCEMASYYEASTALPWDLKIHYVLPHFHSLGNYFDLRVIGGERDGESLYRLEGFNAGANGRTYDPPIDMSDAAGLGFTCGYDNFRSETVGWGVGDQEMCVGLLLVESAIMLENTVLAGSFVGTDEDGIKHQQGSCVTIGVPKSGEQGPPTEAEKAAPLYVPPVDPNDADLPPVPQCRDVDVDEPPLVEPTLDALRSQLFAPACSFSACHGTAAAAGLDLMAEDLHTELLGHDVQASTALPLVAPGDPDGSWLVRVLSQCSPTDDAGNLRSHMPLNAPVLLDDGLVNAVRAWIPAGAPGG